MDAYLDPYRKILRPFECANCGKVDHGHSHCIPDLCEKVYCLKCGRDYFWGGSFLEWKDYAPQIVGQPFKVYCNGCVRGIEEAYVRHAPVEELPVLVALFEHIQYHYRNKTQTPKQDTYLLRVAKDRLQGVTTPPRTIH